MSLLTENKPGQFRAVCRKGEWLPIDKVPVGVDLADLPSHWDKTLKAEVYAVPCALDTTDRAAFDEHMKTVHRKRKVTGENEAFCRDIDTRWKYPAPGMGLQVEGKPFKTSTLQLGKDVQTCPSCGLVAEVGYSQAANRWWDEHLRGCELAKAAS